MNRILAYLQPREHCCGHCEAERQREQLRSELQHIEAVAGNIPGDYFDDHDEQTLLDFVLPSLADMMSGDIELRFFINVRTEPCSLEDCIPLHVVLQLRQVIERLERAADDVERGCTL